MGSFSDNSHTIGGISTNLSTGGSAFIPFSDWSWDSQRVMQGIQTAASGIYIDIMPSTIMPNTIIFFGYWRDDYNPFSDLDMSQELTDVSIDIDGEDNTLNSPSAFVSNIRIGGRVGGLIPWASTMTGNFEYDNTDGDDIGGQD